MQEVLGKAEDGFYNESDEGHAWPTQPDGVVGRNICVTTGFIPSGPDDNPGCPTRFEYFLKDSLPLAGGEVRQDIQIDKTNGQLAFPDTLAEFIETQNHPVYIDPLGTLYCLDCPIASRSATIKYPINF